MKALFLIFHGFNEANGISKKIRYQVTVSYTHLTLPTNSLV